MSEISYSRTGELVSYRQVDVSNHEMRCVILGLWKRLSPAEQADFVHEIAYYHEAQQRAKLPELSQAIANDAGPQ